MKCMCKRCFSVPVDPGLSFCYECSQMILFKYSRRELDDLRKESPQEYTRRYVHENHVRNLERKQRGGRNLEIDA